MDAIGHTTIVIMTSLFVSARAQVFTQTPPAKLLFRHAPLTLPWVTSLDPETTSWCYWEFHSDGAWDEFLGFNNNTQERMNISSWHDGWQFLAPSTPCGGGIRRDTADGQHSGKYRMVVELINRTEYKSQDVPVSVIDCPEPNVYSTAGEAILHRDVIGIPSVKLKYTEDDDVITELKCNATSRLWYGEVVKTSDDATAFYILVGVVVVLFIVVVLLICCMQRRNRKQKHTLDIAMEDVESRPLQNGDEKAEKLEFEEEMGDMTVPEGQSTSLTVKLNVRCERVAWYRNGQKLESTKAMMLKSGSRGREHSVRILKASPSVSGEYTCVARLGLQRVETAGQLVVITDDMRAPEFVETFPQKVTVSADSAEQTYPTVIEGYPLPKLYCMKNCIEFKDTDTVTLDITKNERGLEVTLTLKNCTLADNCDVIINAQNAIGSISNATKITVESPPRFIIPPTPLLVFDGDSAEFIATVEGEPLPTIEWYLKDTLINETPVVTSDKAAHTATSTVCLPSVTVGDNGAVIARAVNRDGQEAQAKTKLVVKSIIKPVFTKPLRDVTTKPSDDVIMTCTVRASPEPTQRWWRNGIPLVEDGRLRITCQEQKEGVFLLCVGISGCTLDDSGQYKLGLQNTGGSVEAEAKLAVNHEAKRPTFITKPQDVTVIAGDDVTFKASLEGFPRPEVVWESDSNCNFKDGCTQSYSGMVTTLKINDVTVKHSGNYQVKATSTSGDKTVEFKVKVYDPKRPTIYTKLRDVTVNEGSEANFITVVHGIPLPAVDWLINGQPLQPAPEFIITSEDDVTSFRRSSKLRITRCNDGDVREVSVVASNSKGDVKDSASVFLNIKPSFTQQPPSELNVVLGSEKILEVEVRGHPKPTVTWDFRNLIGLGVKEYEEGGKHKIRLKNTQHSHAGSHIVKASNVAGDATAEFVIKVVDLQSTLPRKTESVYINN